MRPRLPLALACTLGASWLIIPAPIATEAATPDVPSLEVRRLAGGSLELTFTSTLWSAPDPTGPWSVLPQATSPHVVAPTPGSPVFYRAARMEAGVFEQDSVADWRLTGPFQTHFDLAFAGLPDGIFPPRREKPYFPGSFSLEASELPLTLRVRGNSSLQECPFPKLKLKVSSANRPGTPFEEAREIDIGTHCAEGGSGTVGRLRDERAAWREALAYEAMADLGFTTPRVRRARIEYHDTSAPDSEGRTGWTVRRQALLLEDIEVVAEHHSGRALDDEEIAKLENAGFDARLITGLRLFHALIGNWDYALSNNGRNLWNIEVIELPDGLLVPVAGDFDLASWVTGKQLREAPHDYRPDLPEAEREAMFRVESIRSSATQEVYASARGRFLEGRTALETRVNHAQVDEAGRTLAREHLRVFYLALEALQPITPR